MAEAKEQIVHRLENLARKVKVLSQGAGNIECRVFSPQAEGNPYVIEVSSDRFTRRVEVSLTTVKRLNLGQPDPILMRDLRTAILVVTRLAARRA